MTPTGVIGSRGDSGHGNEHINTIIKDSFQCFSTENPKRRVKVVDIDDRTEIEDMRGNLGRKYILETGQGMVIKPRFFDEEKIRLEVTHYNYNKES